jgi:hypothetical protein
LRNLGQFNKANAQENKVTTVQVQGIKGQVFENFSETNREAGFIQKTAG